jgi:hypothetical protein
MVLNMLSNIKKALRQMTSPFEIILTTEKLTHDMRCELEPVHLRTAPLWNV